MAADPESLDVELAAAVYKEMGEMMEEETRLRQAVQEMVSKKLELNPPLWIHSVATLLDTPVPENKPTCLHSTSLKCLK